MSTGKGAKIGDVMFPYNPNSITWGFRANTSTTETLGGRVIQVLSVTITQMTWEGDAGSRDKLLKLYDDLYGLMETQVKTKRSHVLSIPSRGWVFNVYLKSLPNFGFNVQSTTFPYRVTFEVDGGYGDIYQTLQAVEVERLAEGIGYRPEFQGPDGPEEALQYLKTRYGVG